MSLRLSKDKNKDIGTLLDMENFIKEHLAFILTMMITYIFCIIFIVAQILALDDWAMEYTVFDIVLNSIVPTTITYTLGCVLVNIVDLLKNKAERYVYNILTMMMIVVYAMVFTFYWSTGFMWGWLVGELLATFMLVYLNVLCYREKYRDSKHDLV